MTRSVMISYSSRDRNFCQELSDFLRSAQIEVLLDETFVDGGDRVLQRIEAMVASAKVLIVVLSGVSLRSHWVRLEQALFMAKMAEDSDLHVVPLLIEGNEIPALIQQFAYIDFTSPATYGTARSNLVERLRRLDLRLVTPPTPTPPHLPPNQAEQLEILIKSAVDKGMTRFMDTFHNHQHLLTPQTIAAKEREAQDEIWVVTAHLCNDTQDEEFKKSVISNFKREVAYVYFVDNSDLIRKRRRRYDKIYSDFRNYYRFVTLPAGILMPFDEIVLYEPRDTHRCWGYAQMKYPNRAERADEDLFLRLPAANAIANAKTLEAFLNAAPAEDPVMERSGDTRRGAS